jgi:polar amino acid transport system permease protein
VDFESLRQVFDFSYFWSYRTVLLTGLLTNFLVFAGAALLAGASGFVICLCRVSRYRAARGVGTFYVELFRNTPEYVFLTWVHFVLPLVLTRLLVTRVNFAPTMSAVLALGICYSGYFAETFRAGILSIPRGQLDAGRAVGMGRPLLMRRIVLPQAVRRVLPEALNNCVSLFKATSIVSLIAVPDLMYQVVNVVQYEMRPLPLYSSAAFLFFAIIFALSTAVQLLTERWRTRGWA